MPLVFATYNVKDLFDATDVTSRTNLNAKLASLAKVLESANADVVGFQEVGSASVVRELLARVPQLGYGEPVMGTVDPRGIGCAIVSRLPVTWSDVHTSTALSFPAFAAGDPPPFRDHLPLKRGIVHAKVDAGALGSVDFFVGHLKSNRPVPMKGANGEPVLPSTEREYGEGHLRCLVWRAAEALFVRGLVDQVLASDPSKNVVVAGDMNDHPGSHVLRVLCGGGDRALVPCAEVIPEAARYSILWQNSRQQIDHVLVTRGLRARLQSARFINEELRDHGTLEKDVVVPDSDHAAMVATFG